jgi:ketosteroid isomerase-like protein
MNPKELIEHFYTCFARADAEGMAACYTDDVIFEDPAFGRLQGERARNMWRMLINHGLKLTFNNVWAEGDRGGAHWEAAYTFGKAGRRVLNKIDAAFEFRDGRISRHTDRFNFHRWAAQALGASGMLLGWTSFLKNKVRAQARDRLAQYESKRS